MAPSRSTEFLSVTNLLDDYGRLTGTVLSGYVARESCGLPRAGCPLLESEMEGDQGYITVKGLWKVFGPDPERVTAPAWHHKTRTEVQEETGCVLALRDVSFDVPQGDIFVVMGLSGSGKSTLIRCLIRLIEPTQGEIFIDDEDVLACSDTRLTQLRRTKVAMVFQRFGLFPHRSVIDNVVWGLEIQGIKKEHRMETAQRVLEMVGLKGWENNYPRELSGGMQQRVGLARALAVDPQILLLDEPFSALDPLIRRTMQDELLKLQSQLRKTMVFITHDLNEALKVGNRIVIMRDGEIVQMGAPEEIVMEPSDEYVREFVRDVRKESVLKAKNLMKETVTAPMNGDGPCCGLETLVEELIPMLMEHQQPIRVLDHKDELVGEVHRGDVILAMAH